MLYSVKALHLLSMPFKLKPDLLRNVFKSQSNIAPRLGPANGHRTRRLPIKASKLHRMHLVDLYGAMIDRRF